MDFILRTNSHWLTWALKQHDHIIILKYPFCQSSLNTLEEIKQEANGHIKLSHTHSKWWWPWKEVKCRTKWIRVCWFWEKKRRMVKGNAEEYHWSKRWGWWCSNQIIWAEEQDWGKDAYSAWDIMSFRILGIFEWRCWTDESGSDKRVLGMIK